MSTKAPRDKDAELDAPKLREKLKKKRMKLKQARDQIEYQKEMLNALRLKLVEMNSIVSQNPFDGKSSGNAASSNPSSSLSNSSRQNPPHSIVGHSQSYNEPSKTPPGWVNPTAKGDQGRTTPNSGSPLQRNMSAPASNVTHSIRKDDKKVLETSAAFSKLCKDGSVEQVIAQLSGPTNMYINVNYKDKDDWTPLHNAASAGKLDVCEAILKAAGDRSDGVELTPNNDGNYALHYVVRHGADGQQQERLLRVLKLFQERKANFNAVNNNGETPLHTACLRNNHTAVNFLLAQGANPNIKTSRGETPLHFAVRSANLNNITQLLRFGADPKIAAHNQGTALDVAQTLKNQQVLSVLRDPKYLLIPVSLHSIHLEEYVPVFALNNITDTAFRRMREEDLVKMEIPPEDRKKMLELIARLNSSPSVDLEELSWEIAFQTLQIEEEIGRGSSGVVWRAIWKGQEVAVKQLVYTSEQQLQDFLSELEIMKKVRLHENVVNLLGVCKSPFFAIVSEYLPMGSLDRLLLTLDLEMYDILNLIRGCTAGVAFLHQQNIIHRDIACRNLLATKDTHGKLTVKLTDFGMSRFNKPEGNRGQMNFGPLKWMAPEALSYKYVIKTDIWSLGITMIEMLTHGGDPWPGESPTNVAIAVRDQRKTPRVPEGTPPELEIVMKECWRYEPENRPSAEEVLTQVNRLVWKWNKALTAAGKTSITAGPGGM